jgi:PPOX class probable F420-dependent enzyme
MTDNHPFSALERHQYANLITYRKSGAAIPTPVWFAEADGRIYVMTTADAGKTKRIRNNGTVELGPCTSAGKPLGPTFAAQARVLSAAEEAPARKALDRKYGLMKALFDFGMNLRGVERAWIEIVPQQD